ncbi:MAG: hypothetical protein ABS892_05180, partial [Psychrobacillus sp.]
MEKMIPFIRVMEDGDIEKLDGMVDAFLLEENPDEQYGLADLLTEYGFIQEAIKTLENLNFLFPEEDQLKIDLAQLFLELNKEDDALEMLSNIEKNSESYPQAL